MGSHFLCVESTDHGSNESDTESETSAPNTPHIPLSETDAVSLYILKYSFKECSYYLTIISIESSYSIVRLNNTFGNL